MENRFRRKLTDLGIPNTNIFVKEDQDEYECDIVFAIEGDLYFVECKTLLQPQTPRAHYEFVDKISDASIQLNRITDFYIAHFDNVRKELNLSERWTPNSVHMLILCSAMIGEVILLNDCFLIDSSILIRFLNREPPGIAWGKIRVQSPDKNYTGEITAEKLNNVISNPPPITMSKRRYSEKIIEIELPDIVFSFFDFAISPDIVYLTDEQEKAFIEKINLTQDQL